MSEHGLWQFITPISFLDELKTYAEELGEDWTSAETQMRFMAKVGLWKHTWAKILFPINESQGIGQDPLNEPHLEPLHREFLLAINHVRNVIGDVEFAEKMRDDLASLWHEDKIAKGLEIHEALGMTKDQYSLYVEKKEK